jgi:hypothetical protein
MGNNGMHWMKKEGRARGFVWLGKDKGERERERGRVSGVCV